jgi:hypothetical protein
LPDRANQTRQRRLDAWRRSLALFGKISHFEGPFYSAGYNRYVLEPRLTDGATPDLIAGGRNRFVVADISISPHKSASEIRRYAGARLTPYLRTRLGLPQEANEGAAPFFLTTEGGRGEAVHDINAINLTTSELFLPDVRDRNLQEAFDEWEGFDERALPNYSILALPESEREEVRLALAGVMRVRASRGGIVSASEIANLLLGDLADKFTDGGKARLVQTVGELLHQAAPHLAPYAKWHPASKGLEFSGELESSSRRAFTAKLHSWLGTNYAIRPLEHYDEVEDSEEEDSDD